MWDVLGIEPTGDPKAIRRAYAARLRAIDPDRDPGAFQTLRAAYERALRESERAERQRAAAAPQPAAQPHAEPPPAQPRAEAREIKAEPPPPSPEDVERQGLIRAINAALQQGDTLGALDVFDRAQARGLVRLGERDMALQGIMRAVVADRTIPAEAYLAVMKRIGWDALPTAYEMGAEIRRAATARAEAEAWYVELARWQEGPIRPRMTLNDPLAGLAVWIKRRRERLYARLLLDGRWFLLSETTAAGLRLKLQLHQHYKSWIGQRFVEADIARAEAMLRHERPWRNLRTMLVWTAWIVFAMAAVAMGFENQAGFWVFWLSVFFARAVARRLRVALASAKV